ncbi:hypothetical protein [Saccharopolyspora pogona]|uniref:hypothetical protein n=1 Tax=Saccharopolyspora pogona TaxID=333966 RepID=UPI0016850E44|nr:hypothetical protein [Saccharopolyspora pogona]
MPQPRDLPIKITLAALALRAATHGVVVCEHCAEPLTADSVTKEPGPEFPARLADREDVRARFGKRPE